MSSNRAIGAPPRAPELIHSLVVALALAATACGRSTVVAELPSELITNLHVVVGSINGSEPLALIVDTGASASVIDRSRAQQLGLATGQSEDARTGGGSVEAAQIQNATLRLGEIEIPNLSLYAIDLTPLRAGLDLRIDGIIGYDLFNRYIVELDYVTPAVRLRDQSDDPPSGSITVPIQIREQLPLMELQVTSANGRRGTGLVEFDTGQTGGLTLTQEFVDRNGLLGPAQPTLAISTGALLPGQVSAKVARFGYVRIGNINVNAPLANITSQEDAGVGDDVAGLLGGEILKRFTVFIDYSRQQIKLTPGNELNAPIEFDMTGMSLAAVGQGFRVRTIIDGSPAAEAGIAAGDVITAIDGRPAGEMKLAEVRQLARVEGSAMRLTVTRDGAPREIVLKTRRLI